MNTKNIIKFSALALTVCISGSAYALNSQLTAAVPVSLTLEGSCTIDGTLANGAFPNAVTGVAQALTKSTTLSVNCKATMPFRLGVSGGNHYTSTRNLAATGTQPPIPYTVQQGGTPFGDADIVDFDTTYVSTSLENAYTTAGTGANQTINVDFVADIPFAQTGGTYTDSVVFVVAWP